MKGDENFGISGYAMTSPLAVPGKGWVGNAFSKDKVDRDFISSVQSYAKKCGAVSPATYQIKDAGAVRTEAKDIHFFYGKDKKKSLFTQGAERKQFIPGVATYKDQDIYKERPKLIFKSGQKRNGPID